MNLMRTSFLVAVVLLTTAGCSIFGGGKTELSEEEKAARVSLSVLDQALIADAALAELSVDVGEAVANTDWPQTGRGPSKIVGNVSGGDALRVDWRSSIGAGSGQKERLTSAPVINGGLVYTVDADQKVVATDAETGRKIWENRLKADGGRDSVAVGAGLASGNGSLIVSSGYGYVVALSLSDGVEIWKRKLDTPVTGSAAILGNRAFITTSNNELYALDMATGEIVWSDQAITESARMLSSPSPAVTDDILVAPFSSGELIAYVPANGRRLWTDTLTSAGRYTPLSAINDIAGRPSIQDGVVYAASHSGVLTAIDARSGARIWGHNLGSRLGPVIQGPFLFVMGTDGQLACMNKIDGGVLWVRQLPAFKNQKKRQKPIVWTGPLVASGRLVIASSDGDVLALSVQTGETVQSLEVNQPIYIEPIAAGGRIYVLTDDGNLIAIR